MKRWQTLLTIPAVTLLAMLGLAEPGAVRSTAGAAQSYSLGWSAVGGGGNSGTQISSTAGQTAIGWSAGARQLGSGFWYGVAAGAGYSVYLPVTRKK